MSWSKNYTLASVAHRKLELEAKRSEYVLHRLVAHANLLDSILENFDHLTIGARTCSSSQDLAGQHSEQASHHSDVPDAAESNSAEEDDMLEECSDEDEYASTDNDDECSDIFHTLRRSPPRHIADPLARDFANVTERLLSDRASEVDGIGRASATALDEQIDTGSDLEDTEPVTTPAINVTLSKPSAERSLDDDASSCQDADRSPTEFRSNFEEALMWQLATQSIS